MPWHVEEGHPDCVGYAVVKDADGTLVACHTTRADADAQVAALYANEPEMRMAQLDEQREIRSAVFQPIDVADDGAWFEGYGAVFDEDAAFDIPGVGRVTESVNRGAFRKALSSGENVPMLYHHLETHPPLATTAGGTLLLEEDAKGLRVRADVAKGYIGDAVRELVKRGDIPGMSWGFVAGKGNSKLERRGGVMHRTLLGFKKILDVSPTWDPTYRGTEAQFRAQMFGSNFLPDELQQLDLGARPQVVEQGTHQDGEGEEESTRSGSTRSVAQLRRELEFLVLSTGGVEDEA
jgi:HK97 family phage prohead protease